MEATPVKPAASWIEGVISRPNGSHILKRDTNSFYVEKTFTVKQLFQVSAPDPDEAIRLCILGECNESQHPEMADFTYKAKEV